MQYYCLNITNDCLRQLLAKNQRRRDCLGVEITWLHQIIIGQRKMVSQGSGDKIARAYGDYRDFCSRRSHLQ